MKRNNKIFSFLLLFLLIITFLMPNSLKANTSIDSINESYVSTITIKETLTGIAPFDQNDNAGNDSSSSNNIVRSFDTINYTLEYVTALKTQNTISDAYLCVEFRLPCSSQIATFDMSTMAWMIDPVKTEKDGQQILTGKRYLQNTASNNAIPGAGTLSVGIKVQAANHGTKIKPEFKLYMEGNNTTEIKTITSKEITVSAAPKYNIRIARSSYLDYLGYFNLNTGRGGKNPSDGDIYGRMQSYGFGIALYNDSAAKGFKGIELPTGDITFDLTLHEGFTSTEVTDLTQDPLYAPVLWDVYENIETYYGHNGRYFDWKYSGLDRLATNTNPRSSTTSTRNMNSCYNGGTWSVEQISDYTYRFTIKNYKFDYEKWHFPDRHSNITNKQFDNSYIGFFSAGHAQIICQFPSLETDGEITNVYLQAKISNLQAQTSSGQKAVEMLSSDNKASTNITLYPPGALSVGTTFMNETKTKNLSTNYYDGDASAFQGQKVTVYCRVNRESDYPVVAVDHLFKFHDEAFDIKAGSGASLVTISGATSGDINGKVKTLYAAKPDKTGWSSDLELTTTRQEQLIYFSTIDELKSQGYKCVGVLAEIRDGKYYGTGWTSVHLYLPLIVKQNAKVNTVYMCAKDTRVWDEPKGHSFTMENKTYPYSLSNGFLEGYPKYSAAVTSDGYEKSTYNSDGVMTGGHTKGYLWGNSLLVIGYKAEVSKVILDKLPTGATKTTYDMDINERTITFGITAKAAVDNSTASTLTTNLYITDILPKDLTYISGTSFYGNTPMEPEITINTDGTTTLKWTISGIQINKVSDTIKFNCTIGKAGTNDDVYNNQTITNVAKVTGDGDNRVQSIANKNMSEATLTIIKLSAISISKSTDTPYISLGQSFNFKLKFANNSQHKITNSQLYDILPYNNDPRGSNFSGHYKITSIVIDFNNAPKSFTDYIDENYLVKYITTENIRTDHFEEIAQLTNWIEVTNKTVSTTDKTITFTGFPEHITGLMFDLDLEGFEFIEITLTAIPISYNNSSQEEGDLYINGFYQYAQGQSEQVHSNHIAVQVYGHLDVTKIWQDDNNKYDTRPSSLDIQVFQNGNEYKNITLTPNNAVADTLYKWYQRIDNVPLYDLQGNPYIYTIEEDTNDINSNFYFDAIYDQSKLTVTNIGIWVKNNNYPEYMIIVNKQILNNNNQIATSEDFDKIKLNINDIYEFPIILKELNRTITNNGTTLSESYNGYSGNEYHGLVTKDKQLIFRNIPAGKYEISENIIQYFDFINIEKIENSEHATFTQENSKYYITLSGLHENSENIEVLVTNRIKPDRPYDDSPNKNNLFSLDSFLPED